MVQIVRRKKKGRPSKADLARRLAGESPAKPPEIRRSHRRRNARYSIIDYDDYIDDEEEEEFEERRQQRGEGEEEEEEEEDDEEENRRREKKLKLVVKLSCDEAAASARGGHAPAETEEAEDSDGERNRKKRRVGGNEEDEDEREELEEEDDDDEEEHNGDGDENDGVEEDEELVVRKLDSNSKRLDSVPGTPTEARIGIPLPDKKILELILDKLQKKDTYGVYAEPVDPEELPDYHDVIEHPMDFATVRKRLADGFYSVLDQLESDILLICSNAMQYNSSDTVYHKQARAIQELGRKKFEKLRIKFEAAERERKLAQKLKSNKYEPYEEENKSSLKTIKSNSSIKKQIRKPVYRTTLHETVGSDFSSGATLATAGEILNSMSLPQGVGYEKPSSNDFPFEASNDINPDKGEETSPAKGFLSKLGRKPIILEDNRRSTYNILSQPVVKSDSVFTTFESEIKQLVAVGIQAEYSYARSLARFAATLGPLAWKVASQRIEQALPAGYKFGRGWVGEYEPLPTSVLTLENPTQPKKPDPIPKKNNSTVIAETRKNFPEESKQQAGFSSSAKASRKSAGASRNFPKPEPADSAPLPLPPPPPAKHANVQKQSVPFKLPDSDGRDSRNSLDRQMTSPPPVPVLAPVPDGGRPTGDNNAAAAAARAWMSIGAGAFRQLPAAENPAAMPPPQILHVKKAHQISAESLYNPARESQPHQPQTVQVGSSGGGPIHQFQPVPAAFFASPPQHHHPHAAVQYFQNRPVMIFPHNPAAAAADLARFQIPWGPHSAAAAAVTGQRQKQDTLPPDLNIGFHSPQSPAKQSSGGGGLMVESQQPDLALQL